AASFFIYCSILRRPLHSFPTRRSSDLTRSEQLCSLAIVMAVMNAWRLLSEPSTPTRISAGGSVKSAVIASPYANRGTQPTGSPRSEEHTSELQSRFDLVCRLLLEKKNT